MSGLVSLVGAGPGDPELITLKAVGALTAADLVLYDALCAKELLAYAGRAQTFFVGKRAQRHALKQSTITALLIRRALAGERVVRLKGGDPFVFGRGGEEALALAQAGVRYEIIPGISTAVAAPAAAGIPVTHRGLASGFMVVAGHDPASYASILAAVPAASITLVVLMGRSQRGRIAGVLMRGGWDTRTPAAIISAATTSEQQLWRGPLCDLGAAPVDEALPATLVIGKVVDLANIIPRAVAAVVTTTHHQGHSQARLLGALS